MWIWGKHTCIAALSNPNRIVRRLLVAQDYTLRHSKLELVERRYIDKQLPKGAIHQGLAALVNPLPNLDIKNSDLHGIVVILDNITDPQNLGSILRTCAAFDVSALIMSKHNSPQDSGTIAKIASGGTEKVPIARVANLAQAMRILKNNGFWIYGLDSHADLNIKNEQFGTNFAIVLGSEDSGMRQNTKNHCDSLVQIPIKTESLNVAVTCAVALYATSC